jgi:hypothetical protein
MATDDKFIELICGLSDDGHFSQEPLILSACSHSCCKKCLFKEASDETRSIRCKICGVQTDRDLRNDKVSLALKRMVGYYYNSLLSSIEKNMKLKMDYFKGV